MVDRKKLKYWSIGVIILVLICFVRYDLSRDNSEFYLRGRDTAAVLYDNKYEILRGRKGEEITYTLFYKGEETAIHYIIAYKAIDEFLYLITENGRAVVDMEHNEFYLFDNLDDIGDQYKGVFEDFEGFRGVHDSASISRDNVKEVTGKTN